ncbi:MAG TPA: mannosyltransferase family protein, partial [Methanocella sp.]|nr:mannosyltransferase family protein [Methanocella sp.]
MRSGIHRLEVRELAYILGLFAVTRAALMALGIAAHVLLSGLPLNTPGDLAQIWNVWDGSWYIGIARDGYSAAPVNVERMANYAFFPLYPALVRLAAAMIGNYALAGIAVSNVCLLVACLYLYRYVLLDEGSDREAARRSVKYLLLFPLAFLFSAVLTESLFVALAIACLYYARRGRWAIAGPLGFLIALTRPTGIAVLAPMAYEYARQNQLSLKLSGISRWAKPQVLPLLMPLLAMGLWVLFNYYLTGDFLGFVHIQSNW